MERTEKGFSSPKHSPSSSYSGESNENDVNRNLMGSNSKSQNAKQFVVKHFMSPTVSTNSKIKVPVPRKKILGEKNDSFTSDEDTQVPNSPVLDSRNGLRRSGSGTSGGHPISTCSYTCKSDDEDVSNFPANSSLKPYDPLTNYLSPRPKYLRYKPNRRQEMFFTSKSEEKDGNSFLRTCEISNSWDQCEEEKVSDSDQGQLSFSLQESSSKIPTVEAEKENDSEGENTDEEEDEEFEEEKGCWSLKGLMKFLFLMVLITLLTSPVLDVEVVGSLRDGLYKMQQRVFEAVPTNGYNWGNVSGIHVGGEESDFFEVKPFVKEIVQLTEPFEASASLLEEASYDDEMEENLTWLDSEISEFEEEAKGDNNNEEESDQFTAECESAESNKTTDGKTEVQDGLEAQQSCGALDDIQSAPGYYNQDNEGNELEKVHFIDTISVEAEIVDHEAEEAVEACAENLGENLLETEWQTIETSGSGGEHADFVVPAVTESDIKELGASRLDIVVKSMKAARFMELETVSMAAIWFSVVFIILASLAWTWAKRAPEPASLHGGSCKKEEPILVQPSAKLENKQEKAESIVKPSSAFYSYQETTTEYTHNSCQGTREEYTRILAPDVELLGELVIEGYSSSLRSCGRKGRIETEESVGHASHVESKPQSNPVSSQAQPVGKVRLLNVSNAESTSYGSFTTEKILLRKEASKDGDAKPITTPVRRSSRIRNLSVASP